jgi:hypothetical protein
MRILYTILFTVIICLSASATIINIPDDYPTIQEGIDASTDGDTVLVQPGEYVENINFNGHNIVLGSLFLTTGDNTYIDETIINGMGNGPVVTLISNEDILTSIIGFSITYGSSNLGGGIRCRDSGVTVISNKITYCGAHHGGGLYFSNSSALVTGNMITLNAAGGLWDGNGGGICCANSNVEIQNNKITSNTARYGGGLALGAAVVSLSSNIISDNVVYSNMGQGGQGGGIYSSGSEVSMINNIVSENIAYNGFGGIEFYESTFTILNTIIWENWMGSSIPDDTSFLDVTYSDIQGGWEGEGNIDIDPLFRNPNFSDFHLMSTACGDPNDSPCIDTGNPAIIDSLLDCSWGLGTILSDIGAYGGGDSATVGITDQPPRVPNRFALLQNYPNPFNARTIIRYSLPLDSDVTIEIYDILGRNVETLVSGYRSAGPHSITWDAEDVPSGVYFARLETENAPENVKMVLLK